ncbi:response regulator [Desulfovermiculus halophilus]|jgi:DNA-binding NtrC family response regulator|uniref:response regulator n=1 Tax=Desulfovermiculus halophilus TaxID=339722 RepID=UPI000488F677|nr:response regulator [Desulfovermiculus halophilus]
MKNIKVLLVDDEKDFVNSLSERIQMRELDSKIAYDGEQALELVTDEIPDVVVLDLRMPGIDGLEVLERLKKKYPKVQVIILTGHGSDEDERISKRLGAYDYLQKPVSIDKLIRSIKGAYQNLQDTMSAATYAEAGDMKSAREMMEKTRKK